MEFMISVPLPEVIDDILGHELCHRIERNHSRQLWLEVKRVMPDYRLQEKWLKTYGGSLMARGL